jgi:hypothetical protein
VLGGCKTSKLTGISATKKSCQKKSGNCGGAVCSVISATS